MWRNKPYRHKLRGAGMPSFVEFPVTVIYNNSEVHTSSLLLTFLVQSSVYIHRMLKHLNFYIIIVVLCGFSATFL